MVNSISFVVLDDGENQPITEQYTLTINPTPSEATVVLTATGFEANGNSIIVDSGTEVTYTVSHDGYNSETANIVVTETKTIDVELTPIQVTPDPEELKTITTVLNNANTYKGTDSSYKEWTCEVNGISYKGQSAASNGSIQLRSKNSNSGIVVTANDKYVATKIAIVFNSSQSATKPLDIYGSETAFTNPTELYSNNEITKLGSITYGANLELTLNGEYSFIGIRSNDGAQFLDSITIERTIK